jgi:hypothetical protein
MRRPQSLHAAAFLVHEDRRISSQLVSDRRGKPTHLLRSFDIALEKNDAPGLRISREMSVPPWTSWCRPAPI